MLLASVADPQEPLRNFLQLMEQAEVANAEAVFQDILQLNRTRLQRLMSALESLEGEIAARLHEACRLQSAVLSYAG